MGSSDFEIEITKQGWLAPGPSEEDLCSHGDVRLVIGGCVVAPGDGEGEYGISEAALGLLRTLSSDHSPKQPVTENVAVWASRKQAVAEHLKFRARRRQALAEQAVAEQSVPERFVAEPLIPHGCGLILMMGCDIGISWSVSHLGGRVRIHDVDGFPELSVEVSEEEYRQQIVAFAKQAKELFDGEDKTFADDFDREQYQEFWEEYDRLLEAHSTPSQADA